MGMVAGGAPFADAPPLVGRERELTMLRERLAAAHAGRGSLALIGGEAGIGKTALAEALIAEAAAGGGFALVGRCYDLAEAPPYGLWSELLAGLAAASEGPSLAVRSPLPGIAVGVTSQAALFAGVRDALAAAAGSRPLVLLLDDLHWADAASLDLTRALARGLAPLPILLLATYRSDELTRRHPLYGLLPVLARESRALRLDLRPLTEDDVRALTDARYRLRESDAGRLAAWLHERTDGNPFFVEEVLRTLEEEAQLRPAAGGWALGPLGRARVPTLLRQVIDGRLARLGEEARGVLAVAAMIGHEVPLAVWATVADTGEEALLPLIERVAEARLAEPTGDGAGVRFVHALIREALYEGVLPPHRRTWHRRVAEALLTLPASGPAGPDPDTLAYHLQQAGDPRAAEWLVRSGERAQRAYAWLTAAERYEAALALLERDAARAGERGWLLFRIALLRRFDDARRGVGYLEEAERLGATAGDRALAAYARFNRGLLRCMDGDFRPGLTDLADGVAALDALPGVVHARLAALDSIGDPLDTNNGRGELTLWLAETGRYAEACALGERLVADADPAMVAATAGSRGDVFFGLGFAYAGLGRPHEARRALANARAIFRAIDHRTMVMSTLHWELILAVLPYQADRPVERQRLVTELARAQERLTGVSTFMTARHHSATRRQTLALLFVEGHWAEARALLHRADSGPNRLGLATLLGPLARAQGDAEGAWAQVYEAIPDGPDAEPGDIAAYVVGLQRLAAQLALDAGDPAGAREWLAAHDRWLAWSGSVLGQADALLCWAEYHRATGAGDRAEATAARALERAAEPRQPLALLAAHRLLGELDTAAGRMREAGTNLETALALAEGCNAPFERALALVALAELRGSEGDRPTARALLEAARAVCAPLDAVPTLARIDALAARFAEGAPPASAPGGLSAREVEVLRLVSSGLTDVQVARQLSLSPRTVGQHLRSVYNKLGVDNRAAATRFAVERGLV